MSESISDYKNHDGMNRTSMTATPASAATAETTSTGTCTPQPQPQPVPTHVSATSTAPTPKKQQGGGSASVSACPWTAGATRPAPVATATATTSTTTTNGNANGSTASASSFNHNQPTIDRSIRIGMRVNETPSPNPPDMTQPLQAVNLKPAPEHLPTTQSQYNQNQNQNQSHQHQTQQSFVSSQYRTRLLNSQSASAVEAVLAASCAAMSFDIAEMWLRTGPKTHQLINSHLRHTTLDETQRDALVEVYYGDSASDRTHRLSPALCKKAKEDNDVVWVTAQTESGAKALKCSLNGVLTAVAVPVCHGDTNTNMTIIYFSVKRATMRPEAIEFLVHMSLAAAVAGVNYFAMDDNHKEQTRHHERNMNMQFSYNHGGHGGNNIGNTNNSRQSQNTAYGRQFQHDHHTNRAAHRHGHSLHRPTSGDPFQAATKSDSSPTSKQNPGMGRHTVHNTNHDLTLDGTTSHIDTSRGVRPIPSDDRSISSNVSNLSNVSVTGARLDLTWSDLRNIEYLTDGGNNWIHTAVMNFDMNNKPIVIKQLKPEVQDVAVAINEIEEELKVHSLLDHKNIVSLFGAGFATNKSRFLVLERLDGGTLTQQLGYDTRIRDRRRRFWKKTKMPYVKVLDIAMQLAEAMDYCQRKAIPGSMILHRDLKPDNIGLTLSGVVKVIDFGLARIVDNVSPDSDEQYEMSGETGSLRYMAPEVARSHPYNQKADVYSFGVILWELNAYEKPFDGMHREEFYEKVVYGGYRPEITKKFPEDLSNLIQSCWSADSEERPNFIEIVEILREMLKKEKGSKDERKTKNRLSLFQKSSSVKKDKKSRILSDRHSTWF